MDAGENGVNNRIHSALLMQSVCIGGALLALTMDGEIWCGCGKVRIGVTKMEEITGNDIDLRREEAYNDCGGVFLDESLHFDVRKSSSVSLSNLARWR